MNWNRFRLGRKRWSEALQCPFYRRQSGNPLLNGSAKGCLDAPQIHKILSQIGKGWIAEICPISSEIQGCGLNRSAENRALSQRCGSPFRGCSGEPGAEGRCLSGPIALALRRARPGFPAWSHLPGGVSWRSCSAVCPRPWALGNRLPFRRRVCGGGCCWCLPLAGSGGSPSHRDRPFLHRDRFPFSWPAA